MRKNFQPAVDLLPESAGPKNSVLAEWRREALKLREENHHLRPLKIELARLRSSLADLFFMNSEKVK
jgi:hypothetical protein